MIEYNEDTGLVKVDQTHRQGTGGWVLEAQRANASFILGVLVFLILGKIISTSGKSQPGSVYFKGLL